MSAVLKIEFRDGTEKILDLGRDAIEIDVPSGKESIEFRQTKNGKWIMSFTKKTMEGKRFKRVVFENLT